MSFNGYSDCVYKFNRPTVNAEFIREDPKLTTQLILKHREPEELEYIANFITEHSNDLYLVRSITIAAGKHSMIFETADNIRNHDLNGLLNTQDGNYFNIQLYSLSDKICFICGESKNYKHDIFKEHNCAYCGVYSTIQDEYKFKMKIMKLEDERYLISSKIKELNKNQHFPHILLNPYFRHTDEYLILIDKTSSIKSHHNDIILGSDDLTWLTRQEVLKNCIEYFIQSANTNRHSDLIKLPLSSDIGTTPKMLKNIIQDLILIGFIAENNNQFRITTAYINYSNAEEVVSKFSQSNNANYTTFNGPVESVHIGNRK